MVPYTHLSLSIPPHSRTSAVQNPSRKPKLASMRAARPVPGSMRRRRLARSVASACCTRGLSDIQKPVRCGSVRGQVGPSWFDKPAGGYVLAVVSPAHHCFLLGKSRCTHNRTDPSTAWPSPSRSRARTRRRPRRNRATGRPRGYALPGHARPCLWGDCQHLEQGVGAFSRTGPLMASGVARGQRRTRCPPAASTATTRTTGDRSSPPLLKHTSVRELLAEGQRSGSLGLGRDGLALSLALLALDGRHRWCLLCMAVLERPVHTKKS